MKLHKQDKDRDALAGELVGFEVFATVEAKAISALAGSGRVVHLPKAWALISEDTPADSCYVLLDGDTEVRHGGEVLAELHAGALVGEAALVTHKRRNASVITATEVRALRLGFDDLAALFAKHPSLEQAFRAEGERRQL
jgi:CRP/FNR family cyclic AMP-dependent transcriptional regulator